MDDIDSEGNDDILPFRSLLNDYHLKDLSRKIKSVLRAKAEVGGYIGSYAPYGYMKNPNNPSRLAVDETAAEVVQRIFAMREQGVSYCKIAAALNLDGIQSPRDYGFLRDGKPNPYNVHNVWQSATVSKMLQNETYLGHSVKFKKATSSYKNKRIYNRPAEDRVRCEHTHPAIINQKTWDTAQSVTASRQVQKMETREKALFTGLLRCTDCGSGFVYSIKNQSRKNGSVVGYRSYYCSLYTHTGRTKCSSHSISELALLKLVRDDLARHLEQVDSGRIAEGIQSRLSETSIENTKSELAIITSRLSELDALGIKLYEDRLRGTIDLDTFKTLSTDIEDERAEKQDKRDKLVLALAEAKRQTVNIQKWHDGIREFFSFEQPGHETLAALIDRIEVGVNEGRNKRQSIQIVYHFVGCMS
jgi:hypothetical protein